uniref:Uncharacterized protein n=1 Tax=Arundo donax TaxID=35708 RepID=A0A0A9BN52_ARUDO
MTGRGKAFAWLTTIQVSRTVQ